MQRTLSKSSDRFDQSTAEDRVGNGGTEDRTETDDYDVTPLLCVCVGEGKT